MAVFSQPAKAIISAQQGKKMLETERTAEQKVGDKWLISAVGLDMKFN
jgi:hypothetical protein